jgi:hypothetical protein
MTTETFRKNKVAPKQFEHVAVAVRSVEEDRPESRIKAQNIFALLIRLSFGSHVACMCDHAYRLCVNAITKAGIGTEQELKAIAKISEGKDKGHYCKIHGDEALITPALVFKETNPAEAKLAVAFACRWGIARMSIFEMQEVEHLLSYTEAFELYKSSLKSQVRFLWQWLDEHMEATQDSEGEAFYQYLLRQRHGQAVSLSAQVLDLGTENKGRFEKAQE